MNDIIKTLFDEKPNKIQIKAKILLTIAITTSITIWIKNTLKKKFTNKYNS